MVWDLREGVAAAAWKHGYTIKYDISMPSSHYYTVVDDVTQHIQARKDLTQSEKDCIQVMGYGQLGDGNLHLKFSLPGHDDKQFQ